MLETGRPTEWDAEVATGWYQWDTESHRVVVSPPEEKHVNFRNVITA